METRERGLQPMLALLGLVVTAVFVLPSTWLLVGYLAPPDFVDKAEGQVWRGLVGVQIMLWGSIAAATWRFMRFHSRSFWVAAGMVFGALVLVEFAHRLTRSGIYPDFSTLGTLGSFILGFTALGAAVAALVAAAALEASFILGSSSRPELLQLRGTLGVLRQTAIALGWVLVAAVFQTSWLQRTIEAIKTGSYRREFVLAYGLYFSVMFLAIFGPCFATYQRKASAHLDALFPLARADAARLTARKAFAEELGLTGGDGVQAVIVLLSPLISAVVTMAIGK